MKLLASFLFAAAAFGQTNVVYSYQLQPNSQQPASTVAVTQDLAVAEQNYLFRTLAPGVAPTTLTAAVTSTTTVFPLASVAGIGVGNGICISASASTCALLANTSMVVTGGEIATVTGISGLNVTVVREAIGTAAAYAFPFASTPGIGQPVTVVRSGNYNELLANVARDWGQGLLQNPAYGAASAATAAAAVAAAQAALAAAAATAH